VAALLLVRHHAYYLTGMHTPGKTRCGSSTRRRQEDPTLAYGPGRVHPAHRRPCAVLRDYEASGVDEIILLLNPRAHEGIMESIEIMGKEICRSSSSATKRPWRKGQAPRPVIEKVRPPPPVGGAAVSTTPTPSADAHRSGRQVHRVGDPGGVGRDQRGRVQAPKPRRTRVRVRLPAERSVVDRPR